MGHTARLPSTLASSPAGGANLELHQASNYQHAVPIYGCGCPCNSTVIRPMAGLVFTVAEACVLNTVFLIQKMDDFGWTKTFFIALPSLTDVQKPARGTKSDQTT